MAKSSATPTTADAVPVHGMGANPERCHADSPQNAENKATSAPAASALTTPPRPWWALLLTLLGLFASLGGNVYLGWIAWESRRRYQSVIAGDAPVSEDVFTQAGLDLEAKPYSALLYGNGPSAAVPVPESIDPAARDYLERAAVPLNYETHGGMDVPLYVFSPDAQDLDLPGTIENTEIFDRLKAALPTGPESGDHQSR